MTGRWFSPGTSVSSTNKVDDHDIHVTEILLKVALNTMTITLPYPYDGAARMLLHINKKKNHNRTDHLF